MASRSADPDPQPLPETVVVGRVRRAHGLRGEVLVESWSDVAGRFARGQELLLHRPGETPRALRIAASRRHGSGLRLRFEGVGDRDAAAALAGAELEVRRQQVPPAEDGAYYYFELVGCRCHDREAGDLGTVIDLVEDGGGLLLRLEGAAGELLVPFVGAFLVDVDVAGRRIELHLPPGLIDACTSTS
ncbi:MAG: 16S rRNA processing protein RimM [Acidobacteria bacterium]|nr:MAG: 16S rRNA processing protein RimM [Acidobacteriota bacterium]